MTDTPVVPHRWRELTALQRDILVALAQIGPANGLEVNRALGREKNQNGPVNKNLGSLRQQGLVTTSIPTERTSDEKINGLSDDAVELLWASVVTPADALREAAND